MAANPYEDWRKGYEAGYYYGRLDEMNAKPYDSRTPSERGKENADDCESRPETAKRSGSAAVAQR